MEKLLSIRRAKCRQFLFPYLGLAFLLVAGQPLLGVRVQRMELEEIARQAPRVVVGVVLDRTPVWDAKTSSVWTVYRVGVNETLKGTAAAATSIRFFGGEVDGHSEGIAGQLTLEVGETYLLFLDDVPNHYAPTVGFAQGLYRAVTLATGDGKTAVHFLSPEGVLLEVGDGQIVRSGPWVVQNGRLVAASEPPSSATIAEPDFLHSDGHPAPPPAQVMTPGHARHPASAADVRRMLVEPSAGPTSQVR